MRLGSKTNDEFMQILNEKNAVIQELFLKKIKGLTQTVTIKVMLGDSTITEQTTFDPMLVQNFYQKISKQLSNWTAQDISQTNNEDIRRIFVKLEKLEGNYLLSLHTSIQFHVLLYYKTDQRVIDCQKELSEIIDKTKNIEKELSDMGDELILNKLKKMGYKDKDPLNLFEMFYNDDELREKIYDEIQGKSDTDVTQMQNKKKELFNELDSMLMETYQTSDVLIDEARLVGGEEGCLFNIDLEFIKNNNKEGLFDPKRIPEKVKNNIIKQIEQIIEIIKL